MAPWEARPTSEHGCHVGRGFYSTPVHVVARGPRHRQPRRGGSAASVLGRVDADNVGEMAAHRDRLHAHRPGSNRMRGWFLLGWYLDGCVVGARAFSRPDLDVVTGENVRENGTPAS
jgi:hypothetical protein